MKQICESINEKKLNRISAWEKDIQVGNVELFKGDKMELLDHTFKSKSSKYRACHIKPDSVLVYEKKDILILKAIQNLGNP